MIQTVRENIIFIAIAAGIVLVMAFVLIIVRGGLNLQLDSNEGEVYGIYQVRRETAGGNFLVSFEHPKGWIVDKNKITSNKTFLDEGEIIIYYVFEKYFPEYEGYNQKNFNERLMYWKEYQEDNEQYIINVMWPSESIQSTVRFSCSGPNKFNAELKKECEKFILSFRLD